MKTKKTIYILFFILYFSFDCFSQYINQDGEYRFSNITQKNVDILTGSNVEYIGHNINLEPYWRVRHGGAKFNYTYRFDPDWDWGTSILKYENDKAELLNYAGVNFYDYEYPERDENLYKINTGYVSLDRNTFFIESFSSSGWWYNYPMTIFNSTASQTDYFSPISFNSDLCWGTLLAVYGGNLQCTRFYNSSDSRLKSNIKDISPRSKDLLKLEGKSYIKENISPERSAQKESNKTEFGFIAQEVEEIYPELVFESENGIKCVNYTGFIPLIVELIKQQKLDLAENKQLISEYKYSFQESINNCISVTHKNTQVDFNVSLPFENTSIDYTLTVYNLNTGQMVWRYNESGYSGDFKNKIISWDLINLNNSKISNGIFVCKSEIKTDKIQMISEGKKFILN